MRNGFRIGRLFGIAIEIDWSWLFIFFLITWNLTVVFGQFHPDWSTVLNLSTSIVAALLFFASVLAHELAHSLVAKAQDVPVKKITLFLFGGVSNIQRHPPSPKAEFLITIVGPVTSLVLGLALAWLAGLSGNINPQAAGTPADIIGNLSPLNTLLFWLGSVNILLAVFNMLPGFPLDGGRILRSILWAGTNNLRRATRWASWVGQTIAWLFIIGGIAMIFGAQIPLFGSGLVNGLWLAFIGWFLNSASVQSYRQLVVQDILEDVPVTQLMRSDPPTVSPTDTVSQLVYDHVMGTDDHAFPVLENRELVGFVTLSDIRGVSRDEWDTTTARQIMKPVADLVTVSSERDAAEALNRLSRRDVRQVPVMQNGQLAGVLRRRDIVRWLQLNAEEI